MQGQVLLKGGHHHHAVQHLFVAKKKKKKNFNLLHIHHPMSLFSVQGFKVSPHSMHNQRWVEFQCQRGSRATERSKDLKRGRSVETQPMHSCVGTCAGRRDAALSGGTFLLIAAT